MPVYSRGLINTIFWFTETDTEYPYTIPAKPSGQYFLSDLPSRIRKYFFFLFLTFQTANLGVNPFLDEWNNKEKYRVLLALC